MRKVLSGLVGVVVLAGAATVVWAAPSGPNTGCYNNTNGNVRVLLDGGQCRTNETPMTFGSGGATGPQAPRSYTLSGGEVSAGDNVCAPFNQGFAEDNSSSVEVPAGDYLVVFKGIPSTSNFPEATGGYAIGGAHVRSESGSFLAEFVRRTGASGDYGREDATIHLDSPTKLHLHTEVVVKCGHIRFTVTAVLIAITPSP